VEHRGEVVLLSSLPGETIFQMRVARELRTQDITAAPASKRQDQVIAD
jgi:hypothetical protein